MSTNITGPRALGGFQPESMRTSQGRAQHAEALCAAARKQFEAHGETSLLAWIWVQQNPHGAAAPAVLAVELAGELDEARLAAFEGRVKTACELGKALAVATVTEQRAVQVLFESYAGVELYRAPIRSGADPLDTSATRRVLEAFELVAGEPLPVRFASLLHKPR